MAKNFRAHFNYNGRNEHVDFSITSGLIDEQTKWISACDRIKRKYPDFKCENIDIEEINVW